MKRLIYLTIIILITNINSIYCADSNKEQLNLNSQFLKAAKKGNKDKVQELLKQNPNIIEAKDTSNTTALIWAAAYGHIDIVELLLKSGANIEAKNTYNNTALILAAYNGHINIVELLLKSGANIEAKNTNDNTVLIWAAQAYNHLETTKLIENWKIHGQDYLNYLHSINNQLKEKISSYLINDIANITLDYLNYIVISFDEFVAQKEKSSNCVIQ